MNILCALSEGVRTGIVDPPLRVHPGASLNEQLREADRPSVNSYALSIITRAPHRSGILADESMYFYVIRNVEKFDKLISG